MSKFFDFCDKYGRYAYWIAFCAIILCYCFPLHVYAVIENGAILDMFLAPFIVTIFRYYPYHAFAFFVVVFFALAEISCIALFFAKKKHFLFPLIPLVLAFVGTIICPIVMRTDPQYYAHLTAFDWNSIVLLILFALYIAYLLLRRFYAPMCAKLTAAKAAVEQRKANRKPTKDERIAELEKRVAELESKDKD